MKLTWGRSAQLGWRQHLLGPFYLGGTILRARWGQSRARVWHGELDDGEVHWECMHNHQREDTAVSCADAELARWGRGMLPGAAWRRT